MSDKKQRKLPKIRAHQRKRDKGSCVNPAQGVVRDLLTSHLVSSPVAHRCTLPEIGNSQLMCKQKGNVLTNTGGRAKDSSRITPPPSKCVSQQTVKLLSKRSSILRPSLKEQLVSADNCSMVGRQPKPARLPPIERKAQPGSSSAGSEPQTTVLKNHVVLNNYRKLPDIKTMHARCFRPRSGNLDGLPSVLRLGNKVKLPQIPSAQRAKSHREHK